MQLANYHRIWKQAQLELRQHVCGKTTKSGVSKCARWKQDGEATEQPSQ